MLDPNDHHVPLILQAFKNGICNRFYMTLNRVFWTLEVAFRYWIGRLGRPSRGIFFGNVYSKVVCKNAVF